MEPVRNHPEWKMGEPVSLEEMARIDEQARRVERVEGENVESDAGGIFVSPPTVPARGFYARLTESVGDGTYSWQQVYHDGSDFVDLDDGLLGASDGTLAGLAREVNGIGDLSDVIVWMELADGGEEWHFQAGSGLAIGSITRWFNVANASGEVIPAYGLMEITDVDEATGVCTVTRPTAASLVNLLINDAVDIAIGGTGRGHSNSPARVAYNDTATPAIGEQWGVTSGATGFRLTRYRAGAVILGGVDTATDTVWVEHHFCAPVMMQLRKNSSGSVLVYPRLNVIEGANVTLTVTSDDVDQEIDLTIAATGGGSGTVNSGVANHLAYYPSTGTTVDDLSFGTANQVLGMNAGATAYEHKTLTAGSGVAIVHGVSTVTISASAGSGISVLQDTDLSPSYTSLTTLQVDLTDGFAISNPSAGVGRLDWAVMNVTTGALAALDDYLVFGDVSASNANNKDQINAILGLARKHPGGRLTLTSGTPVTAADVATATTIYYTPCVDDVLYLFSGTRWYAVQFAETSLALGTLTSGKNYDVFGYLAGSPSILTLEALAWTSDTARATAITVQDGRYCKSGDKTRLYLGTFRTISTTQTTDTETQRFVWNAYNRRPRTMSRTETTSSWNYTTSTWRSANNSTSNRLQFVRGLDEDAVHAWCRVRLNNTTVGGANCNCGVKLDNTNANDAQVFFGAGEASVPGSAHADYVGMPGVGFHYLQWVERSDASGTTTWYSNNALFNSGIQALVMA